MQATELVIVKNKEVLDNSVRLYQKEEVFEDMQNNGRNLKTFFALFQVHQVLVNQDLQKDLARRINIINGKNYRFNLYCSTAKRWKDI